MRYLMPVLLIITGLQLPAQELYLDDASFHKSRQPGDGMWVEKVNPADQSNAQYSRDNITFKKGKQFVYNYYFIEHNGKEKKKFLLSSRDSISNPLRLAKYDRPADSLLDKVLLQVTDEKETYAACMQDSSCTQTTILYTYLMRQPAGSTAASLFRSKRSGQLYSQQGARATGVVDNKKNIWLHPPRQFTFRILQLSPFPFYLFDTTITNWAWNVEVGGAYLDPRWINSKTNLIVRYAYERVSDEVITTPFGNLRCKVVIGTGRSVSHPEFSSSMKSYFHPEYGFVLMDYKNVDGSKLVLQLEELQTADAF
ncbi:hypothetical protein HHL16_10070 [Pseudoflavitalea sp. G-6-1-2]|uniref:hypothetical protein n=1 Tax=Pseudoflavitalea sp. G-6-1-2 TaxID=2728841 RepID=UPI00146DFBCC|nr:hypothetical protein [Pseudoflavitalea sp. G-6-1-2]NML21219.1 hypothetical protein [Pseudoflavitalea sp. G-6-1-2]